MAISENKSELEERISFPHGLIDCVIFLNENEQEVSFKIDLRFIGFMEKIVPAKNSKEAWLDETFLHPFMRRFPLENKDTHNKLSNMEKKKGMALGAMMLATTPTLAEDQRPSIQLSNMTKGQIEDCVGFVKEQRTLAAENGIAMSRKDQKSMLHQCNNGQLEARITEQEQVLATLNEEIHSIQLRLDEQAQILDDQGRVLAKIIAVNRQLIIQKQELDSDIKISRIRQDELLQQAETVLNRISKHLAEHR